MYFKFVKILIFTVLPINLYAQIKVIDSLSKLPLAGITVSIDNINAVQITDNFGLIDLKTLNLESDQSILLTSIGYEKKTLKVKNLLDNDVILLKPITYSLNEVSISSRKFKNHLVGGGMTLFHGSNSGVYAKEEARFFPNEYNANSKIIAVQYFVIKKDSFQKITHVNFSNAFGVGIYEANEDGSPGKPLLLEPLVVTAKEHAKWFEVNLEQYNLQMPKYGFVVSFKIFSASFYGVKKNSFNYKDFEAPSVAVKTIIKKSTDSWQRGKYSKNIWTKDTFSHFGIRAMVAEAKKN